MGIFDRYIGELSEWKGINMYVRNIRPRYACSTGSGSGTVTLEHPL